MSTTQEAVTAALAELNASKAGEAPEPQETSEVVDPELESEDAGDDVEEPVESVDEVDEEESEEPEPTAEAFEVSDDMVLLIDGEEVSAKEAVLRQKDYTQKTQALSEQVKEFEAQKAHVEAQASELAKTQSELENWYRGVQSKPDEFVEALIAETADPSLVLAQVAVAMAKKGLLVPELVEQFGLDNVASHAVNTAQTSAVDQQLAELRQQFDSYRSEIEERQAVEEAKAKYLGQWENVKRDYELAFDTPDAEHKLRADLVTFATENGIWNLEHAFAALARSKGILQRAPKQPEGQAVDIQQKKRAAASNKRSAATPPQAPERPSGVRANVEAELKKMRSVSA